VTWWRTFFKSPLVRTILAAGLGTGFSAWIGLFKDLPTWVTWAYEQLVIRSIDGQLTPSRLGAILIDGSFVLIVLAIAVVCFYGPSVLASRAEKVKREMEGSVRTHFLDPAEVLYSSQVRTAPPVRYSALEWEMRIGPDYHGTVFQRFTWAATDQVVYVRNLERGCSVQAYGLDCIGITANVMEGPGRVVAIPAADDLYRKHFLLFPIPPLRPGEAPRRVEICGRWPRAFEKLEKLGVWDYHSHELPAGAVAPIDTFRIRITFPGDRRFEVLEDFQPDSQTFDGAVYEATLRNPDHGTRIALRIRRVG
jgi:hypothetical protein